MAFTTPQESFWHGRFGAEYAERNDGASLVASNTALFAKALRGLPGPKSVLELGANIGLNLIALQRLFPDAALTAVEINPEACARLRAILPDENVAEASILDFAPSQTYDLVLLKGVLIHISPNMLDVAYRVAVDCASRHLLICEYYNPTPVEVPYRGERDRLFKRDFCGEILERHPSMRLRDYGFVYHRDPAFPLDDLSWFLLERTD